MYLLKIDNRLSRFLSSTVSFRISEASDSIDTLCLCNELDSSYEVFREVRNTSRALTVYYVGHAGTTAGNIAVLFMLELLTLGLINLV